MVTEPRLTPSISPELLMVATAVSLLLQVQPLTGAVLPLL